MENVTGNVEREGFLEGYDRRKVVLAARLVQFVERRVRAVDIGLVMLVVVQLHDASRNVRLERAVIVGKIGKCEFRHCSTPASVTKTPVSAPCDRLG